MYSDGIPEALDPDGNMFGEERMLAMFDGEKKDPFIKLIYDIKQFTGAEQNDDITIIELICTPMDMLSAEAQPLNCDNELPWKMELNLTSEDLRASAPVATIIDMIGASPAICAHKDYLHTIISELFSNALEHGVLGLSSDLKKSEDGYLEYYQLRTQLLRDLKEGFVNISLEFKPQGDKAELDISIKDSGKGFDIDNVYKSTDDDAFGRGVSLIDSLCESVHYSEQGTRVHAKYIIQ